VFVSVILTTASQQDHPRNFGGEIERIDPAKNFAVTAELKLRDFFAGRRGLAAYRGPALSAYNRFVPATHPVTSDPIMLQPAHQDKP
jgi:hypothetical protein